MAVSPPWSEWRDVGRRRGAILAEIRARWPEIAKHLADFWNRRGSGGLFRPAELEPAVVGRRHAGMRLEGAVEGAERLEAGIEGDGDHRHAGLARIAQRRHRVGQPVGIDEGAEIAVAQPVIDEAP